MTDSVQNEWHRLFNGALNDTLNAVEKTELATLLKTSAAARQLWFLYSDNECGLAELKPRILAAPAPASRVRGFSWSPLTAAAAGLIIGLFSASMVWGYVGTFVAKTITLVAESFESGPGPLVTGMPVQPGSWSGDFSEIVGEFDGVKPSQGARMLRFRRADYEGKPVRDGYVADLFRIIDLRDEALGVARGDASVTVEARFAALPQEQLRGMSCGITVHALDALPPEGTRDDTLLRRMGAELLESAELDAGPRILATAARSERMGVTSGKWQVVRAELQLPAGARYGLVHLRAHLHGSHRPEVPKPVEFAGLFVDDVRILLTHRRSVP